MGRAVGPSGDFMRVSQGFALGWYEARRWRLTMLVGRWFLRMLVARGFLRMLVARGFLRMLVGCGGA